MSRVIGGTHKIVMLTSRRVLLNMTKKAYKGEDMGAPRPPSGYALIMDQSLKIAHNYSSKNEGSP